MYTEIKDNKNTIAVIGLGYVGLPIALEFAKKVPVIGFDIKNDRIELLKKQIDPSNELVKEDFNNTNISFTSKIEDLEDARFFIIAVPTPIDDHKNPDLRPLLSATSFVGQVLKKGDYVVYESTVYPGCTEEDCVPLLEETSGLTCISDFKVGFSPERINPGDKNHTLTKITKVTSGIDEESAEEIAKTYELIITAGVHRAASIKVAEAAKIIENSQRDINIAFMNELSMMFNRMNINTYDVLEAAGTKWNFLNFSPGLVGGHCIGVDPYYLSYKAAKFGHHAQIINSGRSINDGMGEYVAKEIVQKLIFMDKTLKQTKVLIMGVTFKENVSDIRNSKVIDVINELKNYGLNVDVVDPYASSEEVNDEYGFNLTKRISPPYGAVVVAVNHIQYVNLNEEYFKAILSDNSLFVDLKGVFKNKIKNLTYWSL